MSDFMQAIRYPWRDEGWYGRLLPLALLQLFPIVGQIILVGYGQAIVRTTYSQQSGLPRLQLRQSFIDGLRLLAVGLVYMVPVILMGVLALSVGTTAETNSPGGGSGLIFPLLMVTYMGLSGAIVKRYPALKSAFSVLSTIVGIVFAVSIIARLSDLFTTLRGGLSFSGLQPDGTTIPLLLIATLLSAFIFVALLVSGVRFAVTGSGLLNPKITLQMMLANRTLTARFVGTVLLLAVGTVAASIIGMVSFLLPGLLLLVAGTMSIWFLAAQYGLKIGIEPSPAHIHHR